MSNSEENKKLVGLMVPVSACLTTQGPRVRKDNGQFAQAKFDEVHLTVLPQQEKELLFGGLASVLKGMTGLDDRLSELQSAIRTLQGSFNQLILRNDRDLTVELEHAYRLLRRADGKGDDVREFLVTHEKDIVGPLRKVELIVEEGLNASGSSQDVRICLIERLLMLRHVQAKMSVACGDKDEADEILQKTHDQVIVSSRKMFDELTMGVAFLDIPEANTVENEQKLLLQMEIIDGISPDERRFKLRKSLPALSREIQFIDLEHKRQDRPNSYRDELLIQIGNMVKKGDIIYADPERKSVWLAPVSGYLVIQSDNVFLDYLPRSYYVHDLKILAFPELLPPHHDFASLIAKIADVVSYARRLKVDMEMALGNNELAKRLSSS